MSHSSRRDETTGSNLPRGRRRRRQPSMLLLYVSSLQQVQAWTTSLLERPPSVAQIPTLPQPEATPLQMFFHGKQPPLIRVTHATTSIGPSTSSSSSERRVLGFAIDEHDEDVTEESANNKAHRRSSSDPDDTLSPIDRRAWMFHNTLHDTPNNMASGWLLTHRQLCGMTVLELRDACLERGIPAFGAADELRQALQDWTQEQPQPTPPSSLGLGQAYDSSFSTTSRVPDSLADWSRSVKLEPLRQRRRDIRSGKKQRKNPNKKPTINFDQMSSHDYLELLKKAFQQSSSPYSNRDVQQLYRQAKMADQQGDTVTAKRTLMELSVATPRDARVFRRLARLERQSGRPHQAVAILQQALANSCGGGAGQEEPMDATSRAYLWHGLGQLQAQEFQNTLNATDCYQRAISSDPSLPHPYHALGTLQHQQGQIAAAMKTLQAGIQHVEPTVSHRLHHALGDVYRQAKVLDRAVSCYHKAAEHSPEVSRGFALTALGHAYYEKEEYAASRVHLKQAVRWNPRQATAWTSLAQMEESVGQIDVARHTCRLGVTQYERNLLLRHQQGPKQQRQRSLGLHHHAPTTTATSQLKKQIDAEWSDFTKYRCLLEKLPPTPRSGDRFFHLYRAWARLEERYGTIDQVEEVYQRATLAFSWKPQVWVDWAQYYENLQLYDQAREKYTHALDDTTSARLAAQLEIKLGNYTGARAILYRGAQRAASPDHPDDHPPDNTMVTRGLPELLHTWALCEWHASGGVERAEILLRRVLDVSRHNPKLRAYTHFTLAWLEHYRGEDLLAQHYISLCLQQDAFPSDKKDQVWKLWKRVAADNPRVVRECDRQLATTTKTSVTDMQTHMMRRDPWHAKLFGTTPKPSNFYFAVRFPHRKGTTSRQQQQPETKSTQEQEEPVA